MSGSSPNFVSPYNLGNLLAPVDGTTHAAKFNLALAANTPQQISVASLQQTMGNFQPQSILVDNTKNSYPVVVAELVFGIVMTFPAGQLNWINFPAVNNAIFNVVSSAGINVTMALFDFPALPQNIVNPDNVAAQQVEVTNTVPVEITGGTIFGAVQYNDASITSTGASQTLVTANNNRKYILIGAPGTADIWVNFAGGVAGANLTGCFRITQGGFYESNLYVPSNAITVYCATNGLIIPCTVG